MGGIDHLHYQPHPERRANPAHRIEPWSAIRSQRLVQRPRHIRTSLHAAFGFETATTFYITLAVLALAGRIRFIQTSAGIDPVKCGQRWRVDWTGCEFVEEVPGRCSGVPTIRGTRIFPETVLQYSLRGASLEEILEDFPTLTPDVVRSLLAFANSESRQLAS